MVKVFFTVDVEVWCESWNNLDQQIDEAFQKFIFGSTNKGDYGLPYLLNTLNDYGLAGVFFVEPLFSLRFNFEYLLRITELINQANQSIELHMHTEWVDEISNPLLPHVSKKLQHLRYFNLENQTKLIRLGKSLLNKANVEQINGFRAGNFGFNIDTLTALKTNEIFIDSSYNATMMGLDSGLAKDKVLSEPTIFQEVCELPMTVYYDRPYHLRHLQLCASSQTEIEHVLWKALEEEREAVTILAHGSELLDKSNSRPSKVVVNRFDGLCKFLDKHRDCFDVRDLSGHPHLRSAPYRDPIKSSIWKSSLRVIENAIDTIN
ncbi:MAG: polysaccharide deacetylase [Pseudomonadota bacterium]